MMFILINLIAITATLVLSAPSETNTICGLEPILSGKANSCKGLFTKFTYNSAVKECQRFIYGGCYGSANLFDSKKECLQNCGISPRVLKQEVKNPGGKNFTICNQPRIVGECRAFKPHFYYDQEQGRCLQFIFGGCKGNQNNFVSLQECRTACEK